jgi:division protein CdvB (Snf7/Vps24/ESCRT-III family)
VVPEVSQNLKYVDEVLENLIAEVGSVTGTTTTVTVSDPEAQKILQEAAEIAAQRMKTAFPDVPEAFRSQSSEASRNV